jgi:hypothetical protein
MEQMSFADWTQPEAVKAIFALVTALIAIYGVFHGLTVYREQKTRENNELARRNDSTEREGRLKRFENFQQMQNRYRQDPSIQAVFRSLYPDHYRVDNEKDPLPATRKNKLDFMGFYEELALMVNSGIMRPDAAYYTFGVDAVEFWKKEQDWHDDPNWELFNSFVQSVQSFQKDRLKNLDVAKLGF